jgi:hypothetical protein
MSCERLYYKRNSGYARFRNIGPEVVTPVHASACPPLIPETKVPITVAGERPECLYFNKLLDAHVMMIESFLTLISEKKPLPVEGTVKQSSNSERPVRMPPTRTRMSPIPDRMTPTPFDLNTYFQDWNNSAAKKTSLVGYFNYWRSQRRVVRLSCYFRHWKIASENRDDLAYAFRKWNNTTSSYHAILRKAIVSRNTDSGSTIKMPVISKKVERGARSLTVNKLKQSFVYLRELTSRRLLEGRQMAFLSRRWYFATLYRNFYFWRQMYRMDRMSKGNEVNKVARAFQHWKASDTVFVDM